MSNKFDDLGKLLAAAVVHMGEICPKGQSDSGLAKLGQVFGEMMKRDGSSVASGRTVLETTTLKGPVQEIVIEVPAKHEPAAIEQSQSIQEIMNKLSTQTATIEQNYLPKGFSVLKDAKNNISQSVLDIEGDPEEIARWFTKAKDPLGEIDMSVRSDSRIIFPSNIEFLKNPHSKTMSAIPRYVKSKENTYLIHDIFRNIPNPGQDRCNGRRNAVICSDRVTDLSKFDFKMVNNSTALKALFQNGYIVVSSKKEARACLAALKKNPPLQHSKTEVQEAAELRRKARLLVMEGKDFRPTKNESKRWFSKTNPKSKRDIQYGKEKAQKVKVS